MDRVAAVTVRAEACKVMEELCSGEAGPVFVAASTTEFSASRNCNEPSWHCVTTTLIDVPEDADGVKTQPAADPVFEKSPAAMPETDSENNNPNVCVIPAAGELGAEEMLAVGIETSTVIVEADALAAGPF